ncbi:MAG: ribosomal RNA small subunit methyltransferase A [Bdellovibrionaceae bacterium]|nr:ribosomal RNA small subunit methyltransferase A [Pseudobdellovibrionaceae bacterium]|tara:strand:+ start:2130 stop:2975 length:846 start_codon:yes stop_codon:yes gene_type:complete
MSKNSSYAQKKRKAFGQHFLIDESIIQKIVKETENQLKESNALHLLEIGPGAGAITHPLIHLLKEQKKKIKMSVVEKDDFIANKWKEQWIETDSPTLIHSDFLKLEPQEFTLNEKTIAVSNLPYSVGTAIVQKLIDTPWIHSMVLMFQKEVCQRIYARPGTKHRGSLSLFIQNEWDATPLISVPPRAFKPPPKVDSEVILLTRRGIPHIPIVTQSEAYQKEWEGLLKSSFQFKRKTLKNNLNKHHKWKQAFENSGLSDQCRAEQLTWEDWSKLVSHGMTSE